VIGLNFENPNYLIDTYAWIEYFLGSSEGIKVKEIIETRVINTSIISIAELSDKYLRENLSNVWNERYAFIINKAKILPISLDVAKNSGMRKKELRKINSNMGLADALIYETALHHNLTIVTGDPHFKTSENVFFLE
jgi:predicted nucleic acid-binding protein